MKQPDDYEARAALMWAGTLAHNGICGCGRTMDLAVHFIQHPISAHFGSAHGAGCGVITLGWIKYVYKHDMARFVRYFTRVWNVENDELHPERVILEGIEKQKNFYLSLGMPTTLGEIGASEADIPMLAQECDVSPKAKPATLSSWIGRMLKTSTGCACNGGTQICSIISLARLT